MPVWTWIYVVTTFTLQLLIAVVLRCGYGCSFTLLYAHAPVTCYHTLLRYPVDLITLIYDLRPHICDADPVRVVTLIG